MRPADDGDGQGCPEVRAPADAQGHGGEAQNGGHRGHDDGPESHPPRLQDGVPQGHALGSSLVDEVHLHNGVVHHNSHENHRPDEAHGVDPLAREEEGQDRPHHGQGHRHEDGEGVDEGLELGRQNHVDQEEGQAEGEGQVPEGPAHLLVLAPHLHADVPVRGNLPQNVLDACEAPSSPPDTTSAYTTTTRP